MPVKTIAVVNSTGRQAASLARVASAVGHRVRAQLRSRDGLVARELEGLRGVELVEGPLEDAALLARLFAGAQLAFVNTTSWGDEVAVGKALADAARRAGVRHYVYSSMPDHAACGRGWPGLPQWATKAAVEQHVRDIGLPATFVYAGIYNNNFTSLPYPLFCMELQPDGGFEWRAPFHPDVRLPWLDAEHDVGPAVLQVFKDGPAKWPGARIALAYELLSPLELCAAFSRGISRPVRYVRVPGIDIKVSIPSGYREQLDALRLLFGSQHEAPYFPGEVIDPPPADALRLWQGYRGIEEYAREVFPVEERLNGLTWMDEGE
ncbi:MAG: hypothetical protein M1832_004481 [Thelocarpon impressellum]|nr:MAG: hypothetical protein M1832_004481 [Thelocarpon impressellum]